MPNDHLWVEHLLLGCMVEEEGIAHRALVGALSLNLQNLRDRLPPNEKPIPLNGQIPFTPRAKKVLEITLREALGRGHNYIGTEHILLAVLRDPGQVGESFLKAELGPQWKEVIECEVDELLRGPRPILGEVDLNSEERQELKLKDVLADVLTGFRMWKEAKQQNEEDWTDVDEAFSRWIDGSNVSEFL